MSDLSYVRNNDGTYSKLVQLSGSIAKHTVVQNDVILAGASKYYHVDLATVFGFPPTNWGFSLKCSGNAKPTIISYSRLDLNDGGPAGESDSVNIGGLSMSLSYPSVKRVNLIAPAVSMSLQNTGGTVDLSVTYLTLWAFKGGN